MNDGMEPYGLLKMFLDTDRLAVAGALAANPMGADQLDIPSHRAKRLIVLQRLALEFDIGRRYTEPEVN